MGCRASSTEGSESILLRKNEINVFSRVFVSEGEELKAKKLKKKQGIYEIIINFFEQVWKMNFSPNSSKSNTLSRFFSTLRTLFIILKKIIESRQKVLQYD